MDKDIEAKLRFLEDQIIVLRKENNNIAKVLNEHVKPVCDEFYKQKELEGGIGYA